MSMCTRYEGEYFFAVYDNTDEYVFAGYEYEYGYEDLYFVAEFAYTFNDQYVFTEYVFAEYTSSARTTTSSPSSGGDGEGKGDGD